MIFLKRSAWRRNRCTLKTLDCFSLALHTWKLFSASLSLSSSNHALVHSRRVPAAAVPQWIWPPWINWEFLVWGVRDNKQHIAQCKQRGKTGEVSEEVEDITLLPLTSPDTTQFSRHSSLLLLLPDTIHHPRLRVIINTNELLDPPPIWKTTIGNDNEPDCALCAAGKYFEQAGQCSNQALSRVLSLSSPSSPLYFTTASVDANGNKMAEKTWPICGRYVKWPICYNGSCG